MKQIQPVQIWNNGQQKSAVKFSLRIISDDLSSSATFYYELQSADSEVLAIGNLGLSGDEYHEWSGANDWAYSWAMQSLGLVEIE